MNKTYGDIIKSVLGWVGFFIFLAVVGVQIEAYNIKVAKEKVKTFIEKKTTWTKDTILNNLDEYSRYLEETYSNKMKMVDSHILEVIEEARELKLKKLS